MANTANFDWPLPSPRGNQMEEVAKIATSLIAIDAKLKSTETALSTHKHKFADLLEKPTTLGGYGITDGMTATEVAAAIQQAISDLVNGSGAALDTLKELADALGNDPEFATTVGKALGLRVRVDDAQSFTLAQKKQGRANLDALGTVDKGKADGVASLDGSGKVPSAQLPAMDYLPLAGGTLTGLLTAGAGALFKRGTLGTQSVGHIRIGLGDKPLPLWQTVIEANGDLTWGRYNGDTGAWIVSPITFKSDGEVSVSGTFAVAGNFYVGSAQIASDGNIKGTRWGSGGVWLFDYLNSGNTRLGAFAFPRRWDGAAVQFQWAGQSGQPAWVWGGNGDGTVYQVWNPANFSVNYANSTWNAERLQGWDIPGIQNDAQNRANDRGVWGTRDYLLSETIPIGCTAFLKCQASNSVGPGDSVSGSLLYWSNAGNQNGGVVNYGTWQCLGYTLNNHTNRTTLWKRIG